jgi:hypothetical protein
MQFKTALLAFATLLAAAAVSSAAVDLGTPTSGTPYEPYMQPVKKVLGSLASSGTSLDRVRELMREGRSFRYSFTEPYVAQLPATTARTRTGDCKAKSLWIADQIGDRNNIRYVIGKARRTSKISHAWIMWNDGRPVVDPRLHECFSPDRCRFRFDERVYPPLQLRFAPQLPPRGHADLHCKHWDADHRGGG